MQHCSLAGIVSSEKPSVLRKNGLRFSRLNYIFSALQKVKAPLREHDLFESFLDSPDCVKKRLKKTDEVKGVGSS